VVLEIVVVVAPETEAKVKHIQWSYKRGVRLDFSIQVGNSISYLIISYILYDIVCILCIYVTLICAIILYVYELLVDNWFLHLYVFDEFILYVYKLGDYSFLYGFTKAIVYI
jgi:hypothetical protein